MTPRERPAYVRPRARPTRVLRPACRDLGERRGPAATLQELIQPPDRLDDLAGLRVAARSRSVESGVDLGGDWYLATRLPGGDVFLAIGDSVGHGLRAAEAMLRLRFAMAAFAAEGHRPSTVLARLNALMCWSGGGMTASAAAARYSPHDGVLTWANAGHLPLLLASRRGVRQLPDADGMLLGVAPSTRYTQCVERLEPGDMMLMYTDGLIPHGQSIDDGVRVLLKVLAGGPSAPEVLLDELDFHASHDDATALSVHRVS